MLPLCHWLSHCSGSGRVQSCLPVPHQLVPALSVSVVRVCPRVFAISDGFSSSDALCEGAVCSFNDKAAQGSCRGTPGLAGTTSSGQALGCVVRMPTPCG